MEFTLTINMDNAAFDSGDGREVARILRAVADKVAEAVADGRERDYNGNTVAKWEVSE